MIRSLVNRIAVENIKTHYIIRTITTKPPNPSKSTNDPVGKDGQPWQPTKRVSRVTMEKIRTLAALHPEHYNSVSLATEFRISPEAVKRILKSKFRPDPLIADRQEKNRYAAMGVRKQQIQSKSISFTASSTSTTEPRIPSPYHSRKNNTQSPLSSDRRGNDTIRTSYRSRRNDHGKGAKS